MNRIDFMKQLESLLQNISPAEREEALQYYNEYFNDAGAENEQSVIEALGNPAKVAENIKRDLYGSGYGDAAFQKSAPVNRAVVQYQQTTQESQAPKQENKMSGGMIALIVVLCVLASPLLISLSAGAISLIAGILIAWFSLIFAFGVAAVSLFLVCVILLVTGVMCLFVEPLVGIALVGGALLCAGIGILFMMLTVAMAGMATPAICKGIAGLFKRNSKQQAQQI